MALFRIEWLFYPQWILVFWAPLVAYLLWRTAMNRGWVADPPARFWATFALSLLPPLVWLVPYLPDSAFRHLPYMAPIAWGVLQVPPDVVHAFLARSLGPWLPMLQLFLYGPLLVPAAGALVALIWGVAEYLWTAIRILRLPRFSEGGVTILRVKGPVAFTFGLFRPRVYVGEAVWRSPHRPAVLAHEQAHAQCHHPLLLFMARAVRRGAWYLPFWGAVVSRLEFEAERVCDESACRQVGRPQYARALLAVVEQVFDGFADGWEAPRASSAPQTPVWVPSFFGRSGQGEDRLRKGQGVGSNAATGNPASSPYGSPGTAKMGLLERVQSLAAGKSVQTSRLFLAGIAVVYVLLIALL